MVTRRNFLKIGAAAAATPGLLKGKEALAVTAGETWRLPFIEEAWKWGGEDYSPMSGVKRKAIPTACAQCASRCPALGFVEEGRLVKIEGHPDSIRTLGRVCAKGQAGVNYLYDLDRILYPLKRAGKRGDGKWNRISWSEALDEVAGRLKKLRKDGHPEKFMFHHGWISASADKLINQVFLATYGTGTIASRTCLGQQAKFTGQELTWGGLYDNWDIDKTNFVLNFGSNFLEAHTNHVGLARRLAYALTDRNLEMITFDVRLSNTAAKSRLWVPINPGTDLAVVLAICNVVMEKDLYSDEGVEFLRFCKVTPDLDSSTDEKIAALKAHLKPYTPEWAEEISGVSANRIREVATVLTLTTKKPSCIISSRGATAHYNGVETERAIQMLAAITGNIDNPGGKCLGIAPEWRYPTGPEDKPAPKKLDILGGFEGATVLPTEDMGHQIFKMIKDGSAGRPDVYMWYFYNPVYANGEIQETIDILRDESLIPYTVCVSPFFDESAALADLILPDVTYLERYDYEETVSPTQTPEYYIRQPVIKPLGEARDFKDVCCDLADRIGIPLGFKSGEEFVEQACKMTPEVKKNAKGFKGMKKKGVWNNPKATAAYYTYSRKIEEEEIEGEDVLYDERTGVYWDWTKSAAESEEEAMGLGFRHTRDAYKGYIGQRIGDEVYSGFKPDRLNTSGMFEIYSSFMEEKGLPPLPSYIAIPEHQAMRHDELILTTFKVNVHTLSRTQNCKWLTEIYFDNPAWISTIDARALGIADGDRIKIQSKYGEITTTAKVTQVIAPGVVAVSTHCGRWQGGRYASGKYSPEGIDDAPYPQLKWWKHKGQHPNWIIPNIPEPISGQQRWMDTVVTVSKVQREVA